MSSTLEDGEIINEDQNQLINMNDFLEERKTLNSVGKTNIGGGVVLATVSLSMEQREEIRCISKVSNVGGDGSDCASGDSVEGVDLRRAKSASSGVADPNSCTTMLMARTRTRKVTTTSLSTSSCPMDIGIEVVFGNKRAQYTTEDEMSKVKAKNLKRRKSSKEANELQLKDNAAKSKNSTLDIRLNQDNEIDEDEMVFVRGASPPPIPSSPEILTYLCSSSEPLKSNTKVKRNYGRRQPSKSKINKRKSRTQSKTKRQKPLSVSANSENLNLSPLSTPSDEQLKTLELCKFFLDNECVRGIDCEYMHEEFPCKFYYLGMKCEKIGSAGNNTCKLFHGGPLSSSLQNALRRHITSAPANVLGHKFCEDVLSQKTRDELLCMMDAFQDKLKEKNNMKKNENINSINGKPGVKVAQNVKSEESVIILRQKLCFLNEQQLESLQNLNVELPEQALNLTLWQLNSIGINKGIHLEAILATVLNVQDVDMRKLLPQPLPDKSLIEFVDDGIGDGDEEDEEQPLIIDETTIFENEEESTSKRKNPVYNLNDSLRFDFERIKNAANETTQRIDMLRNSNTSLDERKKEALAVLNKINELQNEYNLLKKNIESQEIQKQNNSNSSQVKKQSQDEIKEKKTIVCQKEISHDEVSNIQEDTKSNDHTDLKKETQDQSTKENFKESNNKISDESFLEVENALKQLHSLSGNGKSHIDCKKVEKSKDEGIQLVTETKEPQKTPAQIQRDRELIIKIEKIDENNTKTLGKISTDEGEKMTLRSQRKVTNLSPSPVKLSPGIDKKSSATKIVINTVKARRLKIPRKIVRKALIASNELLNETQSQVEEFTKNPKVNHVESTSNDMNAGNIQPTSQYTDDWEDCIEKSLCMSKTAFDIKNAENITTGTSTESFQFETPTRPTELTAQQKLKIDFEKSIPFQKHTQSSEKLNDLRQRIEEKKKFIEKNQNQRKTENLKQIGVELPKLNIPDSSEDSSNFTNKTEELPKSYNISVAEEPIPSTVSPKNKNSFTNKSEESTKFIGKNSPKINNHDTNKSTEFPKSNDNNAVIEQIPSRYSAQNKNPFLNKGEDLPHFYNTNSPTNKKNQMQFKNRINKAPPRKLSHDSEEDWDKDEQESSNNASNNTNIDTNNENYDQRNYWDKNEEDIYNSGKNSSPEDSHKNNEICSDWNIDEEESFNNSGKNSNPNDSYESKDSRRRWEKDEGRLESFGKSSSPNHRNKSNENCAAWGKKKNYHSSYKNSSPYTNYKSNRSSECDSSLKQNSYTIAGVPDSPIDEDNKTHPYNSCNKKVKRHFSFEMKVDEYNYYDVDDTVASPTLSPVVNEIASPTYPSTSSLNDYTPAMEIDGHMSFPAMQYRLHEIRMPNFEVNKPESLDKLLRSNTVDPRILKFKEKGYSDSPAPPVLSYFSSQQMSQYDPRRRPDIHTSPYDLPIQKQNPNMLLYRYLQQSPWYQGLMSTMKMQINHSIAELVRALNNFQKERQMDPSAIFDVFKLDCAGELLEIMRNIGIFIDVNGLITEDKSFALYGGQRPTFNSPAPITSTYSFIPQPTPTKAGFLGYSPHVHAALPVAMAPQIAETSFVSCYVEAPNFSQFTQRRQNSYPLQKNVASVDTNVASVNANVAHIPANIAPVNANNAHLPTNVAATPPPTEDDEEECWDSQDHISPPPPRNDNFQNHSNRNRQNFGGARSNGNGNGGGGGGRAGGSGGKRNDRSLMKFDNRRNGNGGTAYNQGHRY